MSRVKRAVAAVGIIAMIVAGPAAKIQAAGIPVIDSANLVQSVLQALAWIQQFQQMQQQILQAQQQISAITGSRNMGSLLNNLTMAGVVPSDVNAVYHAIRHGGVYGLTAAAQIIRNNRMLYNCEGKTGDALRICQNMLNQPPPKSGLLCEHLSDVGRPDASDSIVDEPHQYDRGRKSESGPQWPDRR